MFPEVDVEVKELLASFLSFSEFPSHYELSTLSHMFERECVSAAEVVATLTRSELDLLLSDFSLGAKRRAWLVFTHWKRQRNEKLKHQGLGKGEKRERGGGDQLFNSTSDVDTSDEEEDNNNNNVEDEGKMEDEVVDDENDDDDIYLRAELADSKVKNSLVQEEKRKKKKTKRSNETKMLRKQAVSNMKIGSSNGSGPVMSPDLIVRHTASKSTTTSPSHTSNLVMMCTTCTSKRVINLEPKAEKWKTMVAFVYALIVSWITAFVMVVVHDRVPDMETYPPLPDLLLDNLPHIPWAFEMAEVSVMILFWLWMLTCFFHKHRFVLLRRFFSLGGTIFLLRCITMLLTSLSVPGRHLECSPRANVDVWHQVSNAYLIWTGAGLSIKGVRSCGDYMFSGHTVALTLLNFFITEYTSRRIYFLHTFAWICNLFGIFFILAAHEHYSIDVFVAFYISSRLFLYYHTLANHSSGSKRSKKSWFYFPLFHFFEANVEAKVPNDFECPITVDDFKKAAFAIKMLLTKKEDLGGSSSTTTENRNEQKPKML